MKHKILKKNLKVDNIIPIFLDYKKQEIYRGDAILIKRLINREPPEEIKTFEFAEIGNILPNRKKDKIQVIYSWEWWLIKFVNGPEKDFKTAVKIAYYKETLWDKKNKSL